MGVNTAKGKPEALYPWRSVIYFAKITVVDAIGNLDIFHRI
jgi:hypothetical protein